MSNKGSKSRVELRKKFALERKEITDKRSPQDQLERLDFLFGEGKGATKERAKLVKKIEDAKNKKEETPTEE